MSKNEKIAKIETIARGEVRQSIALLKGNGNDFRDNLIKQISELEKQRESVKAKAAEEITADISKVGEIAERLAKDLGRIDISLGALNSRLERVNAAILTGEKVGLEMADYVKAARFIRAAVSEAARLEMRETLLGMLESLSQLFPESAKRGKIRSRKRKVSTK